MCKKTQTGKARARNSVRNWLTLFSHWTGEPLTIHTFPPYCVCTGFGLEKEERGAKKKQNVARLPLPQPSPTLGCMNGMDDLDCLDGLDGETSGVIGLVRGCPDKEQRIPVTAKTPSRPSLYPTSEPSHLFWQGLAARLSHIAHSAYQGSTAWTVDI